MRIWPLVGLILAANVADAKTLTASCKDPIGRSLGRLGEFGDYKTIDGPDSMKGGVVTISWKTDQPSATIVISTGAAGSVSTTEGVLAFRTDDQPTFFATFPGAAYMVSIFLGPKRLLMSAHQQFLGAASNSAIAKSYIATCELTLQ